MHFKAILFDLDGTLLDTLEDLGNAANRIEKVGASLRQMMPFINPVTIKPGE